METISKVVAFSTVVFGVSIWGWLEYKEKDYSLSGYESKIEEGEIYLNTQQSYDEIFSVGFKPRADVDPWPYEIPVDWSADPFRDANWKFQLHAWRGIDPIIIKYLEAGEAKYFNEAVSYVRDWSEFYNKNEPSGYTWYDMSVGIRAMRIAFFLDRIYAEDVSTNQSDTDMLNDLAEQHVLYLLEEKNINRSNHGLFQIFGLRMLCSVVGGRSCDGEPAYSKNMLEEIIDKAYTSEGVHKEHSPSYHAFTLKILNGFNVDGIGDRDVMEVLSRAEEVTPWLAWPNGKFVEAGDSSGVTEPLATVPELTCIGDNKCFALGDFSDSGYVIVRSNPSQDVQSSMFFVTGMSYSRVHKHLDELSFSLFEHGEMVFVDSGKYGYGSDEWRDYVISAAAHNTISLADEVIGREYIGYDGSYLSEVSNSDDAFYIEGRVEREGLFSQERELTYFPGEVLKIQDFVSSDQRRNYISSLHVARGLEPLLRTDGFDIVLSGGDVIQARLEEGDCTIDVVRGQVDPILGWESVGYKRMEPTSVVRALCPGDTRSISWEIRL